MAEDLNAPKSSNSDNLISEAYFGLVEETYFKSPLVEKSYKAPFNSDDLWQKTGDYSIYEEMLQDDQVSICSKLKKDLILGSGFDIVPDGDEDQEDIIEFLNKSFGQEMDSIFVNRLEEMLQCYDFGFSLTEKIFKKLSSGMITLKELKTRHPNSWTLFQDDFGNVIKYEQSTVKGNIEVPKSKLIHMIANEKFQNPYGTSDLRACYNAYFAKRQVIRYYAIFMEKSASPIPVAKYDKNAPQSAVNKIFDIIKRFQTKTAIAIPKEIELEFLESKSAGEAYSKAINIFNMFIGRALFVPDLLGLTGSETGGGSFSLGKEQIKIFFMHINRRRSYLESIVQKNFIEPIVKYNFGELEYYPCFKFKPLDDMEAVELAKVWLDAVKSRVFKPSEEEVNYFRSLCKFPEGEVDFQQPALNPLQAQSQTGLDQQSKTNTQEIDNEETDKEVETEDKKEFGKVYNLPKGDYYKKVDFKAIENKLNDYDKSVINEARPVINKIYSDIYDQIAKKKILEKKDIEKADTIQVKYLKELKTILKSSFMGIYKDGQVQAQSELEKSKFAQPTTSEEFLDLLEQETFAYIGDWQYGITKEVRQQLIIAIKDGRPLSSVIDILDDEGKKLSEQSLERYSRTKHTEVMNRGRLEYFDSTDIVAAYQYSAVLDDRTCFSGETEVVMSDLSLKPINKIRPGDWIISGTGKPRRVKACKISIGNEWRRINVGEKKQVCATINHPFWKIQQGGSRWMECKDLSKNDSIGRIELQKLQKIIFEKQEFEETKVLQSEMLFSQEKSCDDRQRMHTMQESLSSSQKLVECESERSKILQHKMPTTKEVSWIEPRRFNKEMSNLQQRIQDQAERSSDEKQNSLQQRMQEKKTEKNLSNVQYGIRNEKKQSIDTLQPKLLSEIRDGNYFRNNGEERIISPEYSISTGSKDWEILNRLCDNEQNSYRDEREILASEKSHFRSEKKENDRTERNEDDNHFNRSLDRGYENRIIKETYSGNIPTPTKEINIISIEDYKIEDLCFDIEIEDDHSFLVTDLGIIVHNSDICRGLHGKIFKRGQEVVPPLHFNCRSVLVPITKYEDWEADTHVGKTPITDFIDENVGKGFSIK